MWLDRVIFLGLFCSIVNGNLYASSYPYDGFVSNILTGGVQSASNGDANERRHFTDQGLGHTKHHSNEENSAKSYNKDAESKGHNLADMQSGSLANSERHIIGQDIDADKSHNKKHIKSGFHNTYNKDESGSNSSYYEDSDDRGGNSSYDKRHGSRTEDADRRYHEALRDDNLRHRGDDELRSHNSAGGNVRQQFQERDNGNNRGYNDAYNRYERYDQVPAYYNNRRYEVPISRTHEYDRPSVYHHRDVDINTKYRPNVDYKNDFAIRSTLNDSPPPTAYNRSPSIYSHDESDRFSQRQPNRLHQDARDWQRTVPSSYDHRKPYGDGVSIHHISQSDYQTNSAHPINYYEKQRDEEYRGRYQTY